MPVPDHLPRRAKKGCHVHAPVRVEAVVFVRQQHLEEERVDIGGRGRQPPAAILRCKGAEQPALAVERDHAGLRLQ